MPLRLRRPLVTTLSAVVLALGLAACAPAQSTPQNAPSASTTSGDTQSAVDACAAMTSTLGAVGEDVAGWDPASAAKDPAGTLQRFQADADKVSAAVQALGNGRVRTAAERVQAVWQKYADLATKAAQDKDPASMLPLLQGPKDLADAAQDFRDVCSS
ncbi:hypothetical protein [uncultured Microbacterium sp.]|uniref:hypothetical protein n=1 Tax=uncultured Microbacterium sp. TaxID=191216 RepID=UPI0025FED3CB|nr:hypothetical protein [uncultured Microbacterium sp.]